MLFKVLIFSICLNVAFGWYNGAPSETCETLIPAHGSSFGDVIPVNIELETTTITAGHLMSLAIIARNDTIFGDFQFRGFMLQARRVDAGATVPGRVVGNFEAGPGVRHVECPTLYPNAVVTHTFNDDKTFLQILWRAPANIIVPQISVEFYYTIVMNVGIFWHAVTGPITVLNH